MNRFKQTGLFFILTLTILALSACVALLPPDTVDEAAAEETMTDAGATYDGPVTEVAIRRVN
ncbi:MAG: hypothetical protein KDD83_09545, partial [Caldilineaceae bacterium]|nr:hypothetical protein [Caldilineaceae bacterium]